MKNKKALILLVIILFIPIVWLTFFNNKAEDLSEMFTTEDSSKIFQINISNDKNTVKINRTSSTNWYINDKYEANNKSIKRLFQALK